MLEGIMAVAEIGPAAERARRPVSFGPSDLAMRTARTCYDHLAGKLAVAMADAMVERGHIELSPDGGALTQDRAVFLRSLGVDLDAVEAPAARPRRRQSGVLPPMPGLERAASTRGRCGWRRTLQLLLRAELGVPDRRHSCYHRNAQGSARTSTHSGCT
jgi:hypothetical protein